MGQATDPDRASAIRTQIIAVALSDIDQRLRAVRCPVDGRPLSHVAARSDGTFDFDGCCGAMAEAQRALSDT